MSTLASQIASLVNPTPLSLDPEDDDDCMLHISLVIGLYIRHFCLSQFILLNIISPISTMSMDINKFIDNKLMVMTSTKDKRQVMPVVVPSYTIT